MACPLNQIILQDSLTNLWSVTTDDNGLLNSTSALVGPPQTYIIRGAIGNWQLGVTTDGLLTTTSTGAAATVGDILLVSPNNIVTNLIVTDDGLLETVVIGFIDPSLYLSLAFLRQFPSHLLVDLIANPAFTDCTRQNAANLLTGRQITYFPYWKNYFLGFQGPAPTDPITGMINVREAEDPQFLYYMNNAVPII